MMIAVGNGSKSSLIAIPTALPQGAKITLLTELCMLLWRKSVHFVVLRFGVV